MRVKKLTTYPVFILFLLSGLFGQESAESIIQRMDDAQRIPAAKISGSLTSTDNFGDKESTYVVWSEEATKFLMEFTNPEERGQKVLRLKQGIFLFYPDSEIIIPIQGAALKQALFGDVSYEDMTNTRSTLDNYAVKILAEESKNDRPSWKIEMRAKARDVPYPRQIIWVSKKDYIAYYSEYYSLSDRLLKTSMVHSVISKGKYLIADNTVIVDELKSNSSTTMQIEEIELGIPKSDGITFSQRDLF